MDKNYIKEVVQKIINSQFSDPLKRRTIDHYERINFACPYCGDSIKNKSAKRGNIWYNKLIYICFNCDKKTNFTKFCKDFNHTIDPDKRLEIMDHIDSSITIHDYSNDVIETNLDNLIEIDDLEFFLNSNECFITDFRPAKDNKFVFNYLIERGIDINKQENIYSAKYWKSENKWEWIICLLNKRKNKVLSMQIRNLKEGRNRVFKIYTFESLKKMITNKEELDIDIQEISLYNKLSHYFNILNVDIENTITVFEGYIDSLFYPNSIGVVGVNTDFSFLEKNNLEIQYFFDNDKTGHLKSEEKIKQGFPVFLWNKLFEKIVENKNTEDPYSLLYRISKVKDLNKLAQIINDPYIKLNLSNFFSKDELDIKWIPKYKQWKRKTIYHQANQ